METRSIGSTSRSHSPRKASDCAGSTLKLDEAALSIRPFVPTIKSHLQALCVRKVKDASASIERSQGLKSYMEEHKMSEKQKKEVLKKFDEDMNSRLRTRRRQMSIKDFKTISVIGRGSFAEVRLVREKESNSLYALKTYRKCTLLLRNMVHSVRLEREIMIKANSDVKASKWIVGLGSCFQDSRNLYVAMDFMQGGDLLELLMRQGTLSEEQCKFYVAEAALCIKSLHDLGYVHRDIKPDNFL